MKFNYFHLVGSVESWIIIPFEISSFIVIFLAIFQTDEAWNYYAGAAEMAALAQFMQVKEIIVPITCYNLISNKALWFVISLYCHKPRGYTNVCKDDKVVEENEKDLTT